MHWLDRTKNKKDIRKKDEQKDSHILVSKGGIEIKHLGEPIKWETSAGYVYLLVDRSASMAGDKIRQAQKGSLNFAKDALAKGYLTGLIQFDSSSKLLCEPYKDLSRLEKAISGLNIGDNTHMAKAIDLAHRLLKEIRGTRVIVIVTDGMPNGAGDPESSLRSGDRAKKDGIDIITIGTDDADREFLKRLASRSELSVKVESKNLEKTITDSAQMLPSGNNKIIKP